MDFVIEVIIEFVIELFGEVYLNAAASLMPEKTLSKRAKRTLEVVFSLIGVMFFILLIVGVILLIVNGCGSMLGWIFTVCSLAFLIGTIIRYIFLIKRRR